MVRWANVQVVDVKFSQDLTHQKSLKSVNFYRASYASTVLAVIVCLSVRLSQVGVVQRWLS